MLISKTKIFQFASIGFLAGVGLASFFTFEIFLAILLLVFSLVMLIVFYQEKIFLVLGISLLFFSLGTGVTIFKLRQIEEKQEMILEKNINEKVKVIRVESKSNYQSLTIKAASYDLVILVQTGNYPRYSYGDEIRIDCALEVAKKIEEFDYRMYLASRGITFVCRYPKIELLAKDKGNFLFGVIQKSKGRLEKKISNLMSFPESALLSGILLGGDEKLPKETQNNFSRTGLTHIVAVSGYNVTIISQYLMLSGIFMGLWRRQAFWLGVLGVVVFIVMIGMPGSAVRAGLMGILIMWAIKNGRLGNSQNAILFSAACMLIANPLLLRWDIGFQLSFLATLGIVFVYPLIQDFLVLKGKVLGEIKEILLMTLSAQIFVLPIILFNFGTLSLISPVANLLVLPVIPISMGLGSLAVALDLVFSGAGIFFSWLAYFLLHYQIEVVKFLSSFEFSAVEIRMGWLGVAIWYILVIGIIIYVKKKNNSFASC